MPPLRVAEQSPDPTPPSSTGCAERAAELAPGGDAELSVGPDVIHLDGLDREEQVLSNGSYTVHLVAGDPKSGKGSYQVSVEGVLTVSGVPTSSSRWVEGTRTVTVADGRLTISNAAGASGNKLCFLELETAG